MGEGGSEHRWRGMMALTSCRSEGVEDEETKEEGVVARRWREREKVVVGG